MTPKITEILEKYKEFTDKQVNLTPREIKLFKSFLISSIEQVLKELAPEYSEGSCEFDCIGRIRSKAEEMGFNLK